jgi:hypothetical protein
MTDDLRQEEEQGSSEARYLVAAAPFVGAPVPYLFAMTVLAGSLWDGFDVFWRWSLFSSCIGPRWQSFCFASRSG